MDSNLIFANNVAANTPLPLLAAGSCAWMYMGRQLTKGNCAGKVVGGSLMVAGAVGLFITANQASDGSIKKSITGFGTGMGNVCHLLQSGAIRYKNNAISFLTSNSPSRTGVGMTGLGIFGTIASATGISRGCRGSKCQGTFLATMGVPALAIATNYAGNNFLVENALQLGGWAGQHLVAPAIGLSSLAGTFAGKRIFSKAGCTNKFGGSVLMLGGAAGGLLTYSMAATGKGALEQAAFAYKLMQNTASSAGDTVAAIRASFSDGTALEWAGHQVTSNLVSYVSTIETHPEIATGISLAALTTGVGLTWKSNRLANKVLGVAITIGSLINLGALATIKGIDPGVALFAI